MEQEFYTGILLHTTEAVLSGETIVKNFKTIEEAKEWFNQEKNKIDNQLDYYLECNEHIDKESCIRENSEFIYKINLDSNAYALEIRNGSFGLINVINF